MAEELNATDEDLDLCIRKNAFPTHASVECEKAGPFFNGIKINIKAVHRSDRGGVNVGKRGV